MARLTPLLALALLCGCGRVWLPERIENRVGEMVTQSLLQATPIHKDERWQKYIETVGAKIAAVSERPNYHYRYYIVESEDVNAFAVPDGSIFVTTGLLKLIGQDETALAGVLAHETGHVARRHGAETLQNQLGFAGLSVLVFGFENSAARAAGGMAGQIAGLGYGREMELEADLCSVRYLHRLGYGPEVSVKFLQSLLPLEKNSTGDAVKYFRSHPPTEERIAYVQEFLRAQKPR
ncbi:MAG: M48 family metalloprotease [Elusimicrobiota bacterium]